MPKINCLTCEMLNLTVSRLPRITPDAKSNWLDQSNPDFAKLIPIVDRQTKRAKKADDEQAVFGLFSNGAKTNRDEWVYDFDVRTLRDKALFFSDVYNESLDNGDDSYNPVIKWSRDLRNEFQRGKRIVYSEANRITIAISPVRCKASFC